MNQEIYARKLKLAFSRYKYKPATVEQDLNNIFIGNCRERAAMDALYDKETDFHRNRSIQEIWNRRLENELVLSAPQSE